ncbi:MAG TPA: hypothetical protein VMI75_06735 [Polyangiaceae bacterium]|nr:hypothetical protein [Polyangiaceae bacterium]
MWRRTIDLSTLALLALGNVLAACSAGAGDSAGQPSTRATPPAIPAPSVTIPPTPVKIIAIIEDAAAPPSPESRERDGGPDS